ncbi:probable protein phosphatase 2C 45 [Asparagus officinalis]|uniref:probable protein phosphatase 2C 45 n=1 Tax=Asparagus officinalis TaxID=4686 RepID=UPI00098E18DB|nr:probable protein phosphatase 2C 45 [Asparagus officinalis]
MKFPLYSLVLHAHQPCGTNHWRMFDNKLHGCEISVTKKDSNESALFSPFCAFTFRSDALFNQLDVASSQLVMTDSDFKDPGFRMQLIDTVNSLLNLIVVPVFNENYVISTRRAPYEDICVYGFNSVKVKKEERSGYIDFCQGLWRLKETLAVSRRIEDSHLKQFVIPYPETRILPIKPEFEFLILACDGLWDKEGEFQVINKEAVDIARPFCTDPQCSSTLYACKKLTDHSANKGSADDDISVMIILLMMILV